MRRIERDGKVIYEVMGQEMTEAEYDKLLARLRRDTADTAPVPGGHHPACWPMKGMALAKIPGRVEAANARNKKHGVPVTYDNEGYAHIPSEGAYKALRRLERVHHNNAYYD